MNPNIYDLLAMQNQGQVPLMLQGVPQAQPTQPQMGGVSQAELENPNAQGAVKKGIAAKLGLAPDTGANAPAAPAAQPSLMETFRQKAEAANSNQQDSIKAIENQANAMRNAPKQTDWSALLGLTDSWTGSNLGKMYQKPETDKERADKLLGLQTQLLGAKDKLSDNDLNMLKTQLADERDQQKMKHETELEKIKWGMLANSSGKSDSQLDAKHMDRLTKFTDKVLNPTSRGYLGSLQKRIDSADSIGTLLGGLTVNGQPVPANETKEQRIQRFNQADSRQIAEVVKSLDSMLSQGAATVSGQEHLTPSTFEGLKQKFGEKLFNAPKGANQGEFLERFNDTIQREKSLYSQKKKVAHEGLKLGIPDLVKMDPKRIDDILEKAGHVDPALDAASPAAGPSQADIEAELKRRGL